MPGPSAMPAKGSSGGGLVTFAPPGTPFPSPIPRRWCAVRRRPRPPHQLVTIEAPFELGYERALIRLRAVAPRWGGHRRYRQRGRCALDPRGALPPLGIKVHTRSLAKPARLLADLLARGIVAPLRRYPGAGPDWVRRRLDAATLAELQRSPTPKDSMPAASGSTTPW